MSSESTPKRPEDLSPEWFNANLVGGDFSDCEFVGYSVEQIGDNVGFLGDLFRIKPEIKANAANYPQSFIIKFPTLLDESREAGNGLLAYEREAMFYRHCANFCPANPPRHYYSEYTGSGQEYLVVMEDLDGARFIEQVTGITEDDAVLAVKALAELHAHYWQLTDAESMNWLRRYDEWADIYPASIETGWPLYKENFGYVIPEHFLEVFPLGNELYPQIVRFLQETSPMTLIHGDARMENMAFESTEDGERLRIYDWQLVSSGPAAYDLLYFLCSSINPDQWQSVGKPLIDEYHTSLNSYGVEYSREDLLADLRLCACLMFGFASMVGNIVPPTDAGKAVIEATIPRFWAIMEDLDVTGTLKEFVAQRPQN